MKRSLRKGVSITGGGIKSLRPDRSAEKPFVSPGRHMAKVLPGRYKKGESVKSKGRKRMIALPGKGKILCAVWG